MTFAAFLRTIVSASVLIGAVLPGPVAAEASVKGPGSQIKTVLIPIEGMTCASCVAQVRKALKAIEGVLDVKVDLEQRSARVRYDEGRIAPERLVDAINRLGYKAGTPKAEGAP